MLSAESLKQIDIELAKYPADQRRSAVMAALRIAQVEQGYLKPEAIEFVADYIGMAPVGKYKLTVCTNLPCALRGGVDAAQYLQQKLGIGFGETTADGKFTLMEGECMGACGDAPVMLLNNHKMCSFMTPEAIEAKLAELN